MSKQERIPGALNNMSKEEAFAEITAIVDEVSMMDQKTGMKIRDLATTVIKLEGKDNSPENTRRILNDARHIYRTYVTDSSM